MIKISNIETFGWESAIRDMRNTLNSWEESDSQWTFEFGGCSYYVGDNDLNLMKRLVKAGSDHAKFMHMINTSMDIIAPIYWWEEFGTYKIGTAANSCSTMHEIHDKKRTVQLNYQVLRNIYNERGNHKLDEWKDFCYVIEKLPYSELITLA